MIPKIIHYCWLSNDPIPDDLVKCMNTWKEVLPDYVFMKWDFSCFDKNSSKWVQEAFDSKKYAFAADYIRLYALYNYGGIYLDMDVEVLKSFDNFLQLDTMLCYENSGQRKLEVAVFGVKERSEWVGACLNYYKNRTFIQEDGTYNMKVLPEIIYNCINEANFKILEVSSIDAASLASKDTIPVFPFEYFSPKSYDTGRIEKTDKTYSIHHFAGSWVSKSTKIHLALWRLMPSYIKAIVKKWKGN